MRYIENIVRNMEDSKTGKQRLRKRGRRNETEEAILRGGYFDL